MTVCQRHTNTCSTIVPEDWRAVHVCFQRKQAASSLTFLSGGCLECCSVCSQTLMRGIAAPCARCSFCQVVQVSCTAGLQLAQLAAGCQGCPSQGRGLLL
jgi:hypothetical protein